MSASLGPRHKAGSINLLDSYATQLGDTLRQRQSAVALRAAKVDAELAYKARGAFLASMNHELRTPLNAISGFAGLLRQADEMGIEADQRTMYLDYILQSADLLLSHINTIIEIADAESGGERLARRAFDINDVIEQVSEQLIEVWPVDMLNIKIDAPDALPPVDADPDKIARALQHLIDFIAAPEEVKTTITLTLRAGVGGRSADYIYIAVESDRHQFTTSAIDRALRVFEQVHEGLHRGFNQRELGLPIAKSYVELNGGKFNLKPMGEGNTMIRFALQIAKGEHLETYERLTG